MFSQKDHFQPVWLFVHQREKKKRNVETVYGGWGEEEQRRSVMEWDGGQVCTELALVLQYHPPNKQVERLSCVYSLACLFYSFRLPRCRTTWLLLLLFLSPPTHFSSFFIIFLHLETSWAEWQVDVSPELLLAPLLSSFCLLGPHLSSCQRPCPVDLVRDTLLALPGAHVAPICQEDDEFVPLEPSCPIMRAGESCALWNFVGLGGNLYLSGVHRGWCRSGLAAISVPEKAALYHRGSQRQRVRKHVLHEQDAYRTAYIKYYDRLMWHIWTKCLPNSEWMNLNCFSCYSWSQVSLCPTYLYNVPQRPELLSYRETLSRIETHLKTLVRRGSGYVSNNRSNLLKIHK